MITLKRVMASCSCLKKRRLVSVRTGFSANKGLQVRPGPHVWLSFLLFSTELLPQICVTELCIDLLVKAVEDSLTFKNHDSYL